MPSPCQDPAGAVSDAAVWNPRPGMGVRPSTCGNPSYLPTTWISLL